MLELLAQPNPVFNGDLGLVFRLDGTCERLEAELYSAGLVLVWQGSVEGGFKGGWNRRRFALPDLPQGYYSLRASAGGRSRLFKLYLLRR